MSNRPLILTAALVLSLTACTANLLHKPVTLKYALTYNTTDESMRTPIAEAVLRVVDGRLKALGGTALEKHVDDGIRGTVLTVTPSDPAMAAPLTEGLTSPFSFQIMRQAASGETPDVTVEAYGGFKATGVNETSVSWLTAGTDPKATGMGTVLMQFTPAGKDLIQKVFADNKGKRLGIFVRGKLVSQLMDDGTLKDNIFISGIPSVAMASIFADDVDVGSHVTFTPMQ